MALAVKVIVSLATPEFGYIPYRALNFHFKCNLIIILKSITRNNTRIAVSSNERPYRSCIDN